MIMFDEHGNRVPKVHFKDTPGQHHEHHPGWPSGLEGDIYHALAFPDMRWWRPTYWAVPMARGYRMLPLDRGEFLYVPRGHDFWAPATRDQARVPNVAAAEMWARFKCRG